VVANGFMSNEGGASDPRSWAVLLEAVKDDGAIVVVAIVPWLVLLLIWRGSEKLGVVGLGTQIKKDLEYVIALVEHALGKKPSRDSERASHRPVMPSRP
jgi:hypothetical protein